jgi:ornithine--oxo-acid transaminase
LKVIKATTTLFINMSPSAISPNELATKGLTTNGKHQASKTSRSNSSPQEHLTTADVIQLEHQYGAHK